MKGKQTEPHTFISRSLKILLSALILVLFFSSCSQVEDTGISIRQPENPAATDAKYCTVRLSLSVDESVLRSIIPSYNLESLYYKFGYIRETDSDVFEFPASGSPGADYATITAKQFQILTGKYMFSLTAYPDSSCTAGTQVLVYDSAATALGADSTSIDFPLAPPAFSGEAVKGSVSAKFSFPVLADISSVSAKLVLISSPTTVKDTQTLAPVESGGVMTVTYAVSDITSDTYILLLTFTDSFGKETVVPERVTVVTNGTSTPTDSTGIINLSEKVVPKYRCHVKATGNDTTGTGSFASPYKTIGGAITGISDYDMADKNWTIVVNGEVTGISTISSVSASSLTIEGYARDSVSDVLNGNSEGSVLTISTEVPVTLKNIKITNGKAEYGGGLYLSNSDVRLSDGVIITLNKATSNGGGVYNNGTLYLYGSAIIGNEELSGMIIDSTTANTASNGGGVSNSGTVYLGYSGKNAGGTLIATPFTGRISGNFASNQGGGFNNTGTIFANGGAITGNASKTNGGGIYNNNGTVYLSGSSVIGSLSADTAPASGSSVETVTAAGGNYSAAGGSSGEGGGIYSSGGKIYLGYTDADTPDASFTGGICANYSAMAAGGVSLASKAELYMSGGNLSYNRSKNGGGAIKTAGAAVIRMSGGTVTGNRAGGAGGGIYVGSAESFYMTGGIVSDNEGTGGGVYSNGGTFSIGGNSYIPVGEGGKNVVYLYNDAKITIASPLTSTKTVATITPASYTEGKEILALAADCSESLAAGSAKFAVTPNGTQTWTLDTEGKLAKSTGLDATAMASFEPTAGESYNFVITGGDSKAVNEFIRTLCDKTKNTSSTLIGESVLDLSKCDFAVAFSSLEISRAESVIPQNFTTVILPAVTAPSDIQGFRFKNAFQNVQEVIVPSGATKLYVEDGVVYSKDKTQLVWYPASKEGESYTVLPTVTTINAHAVEYAKNLKTMILPDGLKTINSDAFYQAKIEYITIPEGVVSIYSEVFCNCAKLQTVSLPSTLTTLSSRAFGYCSLLKTVNIPSKLTNLYDDAFVSCSSLQSITIPAGITSIHSSSFSGCTSLTSVVFENTSGWTDEDGNAVTVDTPAAGATAVRSGKTLTRK